MTEKPHIVIVAKGGPSWLGGRQYSLNLLKALLAYRDTDPNGSGAYDVSVLVKGQAELEHYGSVRDRLRVCADIESLLEPLSLARRIRWKLKLMFFGWTNPRFEEPLVKIGATFAYPFSSAKIASADWIPDFQYHHFPDMTSAQDIENRKTEFKNIVNLSQNIILSSRHSEIDCIKLYPNSERRTAVINFRVFSDFTNINSDPYEFVTKYNLPERFFLVSNAMIPTKNHEIIFNSLSGLSSFARNNIHIVCTGEIYDYRNPGFYNNFLNRIHTLGLRDNISILGVIPKCDQMQLLRHAKAYLQPSLFEGWNTGVEEARMIGKPILLSDIPVHREQAPPRAVYFDPRDPLDLAKKMRAMADDQNVPGFDRAAESAAMDDYKALQIEFGRALFTICTDDAV